MTPYRTLNAPFIAAMAAAIRDALGDDADEVAFLDTLEGETDALAIADWLIAKMQDRDAMAAAVLVQIGALRTRQARMDAASDGYRAQLLPLLDAIGIAKLERPLATISTRAGVMSVHITDAGSIPTQLSKVTMTPDKAAIRAQLQAGEAVPGAELVRGADGITVRVA